VKTVKKDKRSPVAQPLGSWHGDPNDVVLNYSQFGQIKAVLVILLFFLLFLSLNKLYAAT
jgi:hypothetical protein